MADFSSPIIVGALRVMAEAWCWDPIGQVWSLELLTVGNGVSLGNRKFAVKGMAGPLSALSASPCAGTIAATGASILRFLLLVQCLDPSLLVPDLFFSWVMSILACLRTFSSTSRSLYLRYGLDDCSDVVWCRGQRNQQ